MTNNHPSVTTTTVSKRSHKYNRRHPLVLLRKMFKNRRKAKLAKQQQQKEQRNNNNEILGYNYDLVEESPIKQQQMKEQPKRVFSIRKKNIQTKFESPPRPSRMPKEIKITPGTPDSVFSAVSGATGLHTTDNQNTQPMSRSMFKSVLPEMNSETEECSLDRSTYSWSSKVKGVGVGSSNKNNRIGGNGKLSSAKSRGGYMIGASSSGSILSEESDAPSRKLFSSPSKANSKTEKKSFLSKSKTFKNIINYTFESIDIDNSGTIDKKEIYTGLLLIHLKLATYVGPAACRPVSKEYVFEMFDVLDVSQTGTLNKEEFTALMTILCSQITTRVFVQLSMTLLIVPFISQYLVDLIKDLFRIVCIILAEIDEKEAVSEFVWSLVLRGWEFVLSLTPPILQRFIGSFYNGLSESFLESMPLTIMSCLLASMIIPWLLYKSDEFFNRVAVNRSSTIIVKKP